MISFETSKGAFTITADSFNPKENGAARIFTISKMDREIVSINKPATLAIALREMATWLDNFPASK